MVQVLLIDWPKVGWVLVGGLVWWVGLLTPNISVSPLGISKMVRQVDWWCSCWRCWTTPCPSSRCPPEVFFMDKWGGPFWTILIFWNFLWDRSFMLWWCSCWRWWNTPCPCSCCPPEFFFWRISRFDHSVPFLFSELFCGTPPSCLKVVVGGWWVVVAYRILVSAPVPFWANWGWNWVGLGWDWVWGDWGLKGWGLGLDNMLD